MQVRKKFRRIKRFAYLGAFTGTVIGVRRARARRASGAHLGAPASWPPLEPSGEAPVAALGDLATSASNPEPAPEPAGAWVAPLADGSCPLSHPIKANDNSRIFHEPGGRFYQRTRAERCYVDAAAAAADGYRPAKGANDREVTG
jgi:hypothetical protein